MTGVVPKIEREPVYGLRPNEQGGIWVPQRPRPRRNRKNEPIRAMTRENRYNLLLSRDATFLLQCQGQSRANARRRFFLRSLVNSHPRESQLLWSGYFAAKAAWRSARACTRMRHSTQMQCCVSFPRRLYAVCAYCVPAMAVCCLKTSSTRFSCTQKTTMRRSPRCPAVRDTRSTPS